jgi:hypothetical protein
MLMFDSYSLATGLSWMQYFAEKPMAAGLER